MRRHRWNARVGGDAGIRALERTARTSGSAVDAQAWGRALRRAGQFDAATAERLDVMGPEAWSAWLFGGEFEWRPATSKGSDSYPYAVYDDWPCPDPDSDDCDDDECTVHGEREIIDWRLISAVDGFAVRRHADGSPMIVRTRWTVDDAKNWDSVGEDLWPIESVHAKFEDARARADRAGSWIEYCEWAKENGKDPARKLPLGPGEQLDPFDLRRSKKAIVAAARREEKRFAQALKKLHAEQERLRSKAHHCITCGAAVVQDPSGDSVWVDHTGGDACNEGVHAGVLIGSSIGWQLEDAETGDNPPDMPSYAVYSREYLEEWLADQPPQERERWQLLEIHEGDIEEPFIATGDAGDADEIDDETDDE